MIELCSEPLYIISSTRLEFGRRASIDTAAMISKCLVTLALVTKTRMAPALVFAVAQLAFSGVILLGYLRYGLQLWKQVRGWGCIVKGCLLQGLGTAFWHHLWICVQARSTKQWSYLIQCVACCLQRVSIA